MSTILLTGASGFLGSALLVELSKRHHVLTLARKTLPQATNQTHFIGNFTQFEDLRQLDTHSIDACVHLAAVTGGCIEREGILINVEGTRCLMRYLIDRGCRKFVNASSIAVVGIQDPANCPLHFPISDEHPCLDKDGYGVSKYLMEEVTKYLCHQNPKIDVINLRLAALYPDDNPPAKVKPCQPYPWALGSITMLPRSQAVKAFTLAVESPTHPGIRILNTVSKQAWVEGATADVLKAWWGNELNLNYIQNHSNPKTYVFSSEAIERELGFIAKE